MLRDEDLVELVRCQTLDDGGGGDDITPGLMPDGSPAIVPAGERWHIRAIQVVNTNGSGQPVFVWFLPDGVDPSASLVEWLQIPGGTHTALSTTTYPSAALAGGGTGVFRVLVPGDQVWIMGGAQHIGITILGWRVKA